MSKGISRQKSTGVSQFLAKGDLLQVSDGWSSDMKKDPAPPFHNSITQPPMGQSVLSRRAALHVKRILDEFLRHLLADLDHGLNPFDIVSSDGKASVLIEGNNQALH